MELTLVLSTDVDAYEATLGQYIETNIAGTREDRLLAQKAAETAANSACIATDSAERAKGSELVCSTAAARADDSAKAALSSEQHASHYAQTAQASSIDAVSAASKASASAASAGVSATNATKSASAAAVSEQNAAATLAGALVAKRNLADVTDNAAARANLDVPDNASVAGKVSKAGDVMTGALHVPITRFNQQLPEGNAVPQIYNDPGKYNMVFRTGPANAYKYSFITEDGTLTLPGRPVWGATPWDTGNFDPNAKVNKSGDTLAGRLSLSGENWQADFGLRSGNNDNTWVYLRARKGGGLDIISSAYDAVPWNISNTGEVWQAEALHVGGATHFTDGNIWGGVWGNDYLSNRVNSKANAGAQCQRNELVEFGNVTAFDGRQPLLDLPEPWVLCGLRVTGDAVGGVGIIYLRGTWLRNQ